MSDKEKIAVYETEIESVLAMIEEKLAEFGDPSGLSLFEQGRQLAYMEMQDTIKSHLEVISEVIEDS